MAYNQTPPARDTLISRWKSKEYIKQMQMYAMMKLKRTFKIVQQMKDRYYRAFSKNIRAAGDREIWEYEREMLRGIS